MRKSVRRLALLLALAPGVAQATDATVDITLDKATVIRMPAHAQTIVIGNPIIADVTTLKADGLVVVTGKGYGETNMIFLDNTGNAIEETTVRVRRTQGLLTVQRGMDRQSYSCAPRCEPTVSLGDDSTYLKDASGQITSRNSLAAPAAPATGK